MAVFSGPEISNEGLVLNLDAANPRSYSGSGTLWTDLSGNENNGTLINGIGYSNTNKGAMLFDSANDYVSINSSSSLNISGKNLTLSFWINSAGLASAQHGDGIVAKHSGSNDGLYEILLIPSGSQNTTFFRMFGVGVYNPQLTKMNINTNYNITCVYDNGVMRNYINGIEEGTGFTTNTNITTANTVLYIGQRISAGAVSAFGGNIYTSMIYNRALSPAEVKQNFEATRGRYGI
jgi:hypothetical protein